jgi:natural product precursor
MKKLGKLKLRTHEMRDYEMRNLFGGYGGSGTYDDPYQLPEVVVYGNYTGPCPACAAGYQWMQDANYHPLSVAWGCLIMDIEHLVGCCGHR